MRVVLGTECRSLVGSGSVFTVHRTATLPWRPPRLPDAQLMSLTKLFFFLSFIDPLCTSTRSFQQVKWFSLSFVVLLCDPCKQVEDAVRILFSLGCMCFFFHTHIGTQVNYFKELLLIIIS